MSMSAGNLVSLRCHGRFYTVFISKFHQQWVHKGIAYLNIPIRGRVITIWDEVFWKLRVSVDRLVIRKKVFLEFSHCIETYFDMVVEVLKLWSIVAFEICLDEDLIEYWWADIMLQSPHATKFCRLSTFQWWSLPVSSDHIGRLRRLWWIFLG